MRRQRLISIYVIYSDTWMVLPNYTDRSGGSQDSIVGIAIGYGLNGRGVGVRVPVVSIILSTSSRPALGPTQSPIQWVPGALSPGVKRPGREADHSPPTSVGVKKNDDLYIHSHIRLQGRPQWLRGVSLLFLG
jgi:hypothetical protein